MHDVRVASQVIIEMKLTSAQVERTYHPVIPQLNRAVLLALRAVPACNGSDFRGARTHRRTSREFRVSIEEGAMW